MKKANVLDGNRLNLVSNFKLVSTWRFCTISVDVSIIDRGFVCIVFLKVKPSNNFFVEMID